MKKISCEDLDVDCANTIEAETVIKLIKEVKKHVEDEHPKLWDEKMRYMNDEEIEKFISASIKET